MNYFEDDVKTRLIAQGLKTLLLVGSSAVLPDKGDVVHFRTYGGPGPFGTHNDGITAYRRPSGQFVVHAETYKKALQIALQVYSAITFQNAFIGSTWYMFMRPKQEPFDLGLDGQGRAQQAFNVECLKRPS